MLEFIRRIFGSGNKVDYKALVSQGAIIVDVRTPAEFKSGHIKGSINIPLDIIRSKAEELKKKHKPIITCCRSGNRSSMARGILESAQIECYNGRAWNSLDNKIY